VSGVRDALRVAGPNLQVMASVLAIAVKVLPAVLALLIRPVHNTAMIAVCDVAAVEVVGRFQGYGYMPDPPGGVAHPEDHIAWTALRQVLQMTSEIVP